MRQGQLRMNSVPSISATLWALVGVSVVANLGTAVFPNVLSLGVEAAVLTFLPCLFAFAHGSIGYRFSDMVAFAVICLVVSNVLENTSILTGFPFGHYHFTERLGPKLLAVPLVIGPAYIGMGYLSWMLARVILGTGDHRQRYSTFTLPVLASFLMVAWNLSFDPLASTLRRVWIWEEGGSYFGVPLSNFLGWYLTVYVFFQLFALYLRRRETGPVDPKPRSKSYWLQPVVFYGVTAVRIVLVSALSAATTETVADQAGVVWRIHDMFVVCALVCLFTMVPFTVLGLVKVAEMAPFAGSEGSVTARQSRSA